MSPSWSLDFDESALTWCAQQMGQTVEVVRNRLCSLLDRLMAEYADALDIALTDDQKPRYARRLWACIEYHARRLAGAERLDLESVVSRIQAGKLDMHAPSCDLLRDVTLAQGLEFHDPGAAEVFERDYLPGVRLAARRLSGPRGEALVENFAADLVLPPPGKPPKIARFHGRTSLAGWLRVVTINHLTSEFRRRGDRTLQVDEPAAAEPEQAAAGDRRMCQELLSGLIRGALTALAAEDRLLIRMLVLDGVPQGQLARSLGIHSGNLTRRRQRISDTIWQRVKQDACRRGQDRAATDCLELIVADGDRQLSQSLGEVLARGLQTEETESRSSAEP